MVDARSRHGVPDLVTSAYGLVVAILSAAFGLVGHGLVVGTGPVASPRAALSALAVSAVAGGLTTAYARRHRAGVVTALTLVLGQLGVHLVLASTHSGESAHPVHAHSAAALDPSGHAAMWSPTMLAAHVVASALAFVALVAAGRAASWIAARAVVASRPRAGRVVARTPVPVSVDSPRPVSTLLASRGGTRAPPCLV